MKGQLRWQEFRKVIASVFGKPLLEIGFKNPGFKMYRFREHFIDIIQFSPNKYHTSYTIEFGSHPRKDKYFKEKHRHSWKFMLKEGLR